MNGVRVVRLAGREIRVAFERGADGVLTAEVSETGGSTRRLAVAEGRDGSLLLDGAPFEFRLAGTRAAGFVLEAGGDRWPVEVLSEAEAVLGEAGRAGGRARGPIVVRAPMPGRVVAVAVSEGDPIERGAGLFVIEAMKMENEIRAPSAGIVRGIRRGEGDAVELDEELCVIDPTAQAAPPTGDGG